MFLLGEQGYPILNFASVGTLKKWLILIPRCYITEIKILISWFLLPNSLACKIISTTTNFKNIVWKFAYFCFLMTWCYWNDLMINRIVFLKTSSYHKIKCYKSKRNWLLMCFLISALKLIDFEQVIIFHDFIFFGQIRSIKYVSQDCPED